MQSTKMSKWRVIGSIALAIAAGGTGCAAPATSKATVAPDAKMEFSVTDHSYAVPAEVEVTHVDLRLNPDFDRHILEGVAVLELERHEPNAPLRLDTRDLHIVSVDVPSVDGAWARADWATSPDDPILGTGLGIALPEGATSVRITYETSPKATGLQWLSDAQTTGHKPFLYSQSQAIHARSWVPCQDTPSVRMTFEAVVGAPAGFTALMAAEQLEEPGHFKMDQPIPSYLLALAVGELEFRALGERSGVWAEPALVDAAAQEFVDVERMITVTEGLYGPYVWGRYDLLVLPPAFPFGGMENPRLTFATPTILSGDRSLVALIAHELAHSWSGNLVTNAAWDSLWLNEGFTVYVERRIVEALYGRERVEMEASLGLEELLAAFKTTPPADQRLRVDLTGRDPDEGISTVPYEKGSLLLRHLEETYGRAVFDPFLAGWFKAHAFESVTTQMFIDYAHEHLIDIATPVEGATKPDLLAWIDQPGLGPNPPQPQATSFKAVDQAAATWSEGSDPKALSAQAWTWHHWVRFLRQLPADVTPAALARLDEVWSLSTQGNAEILAQWIELCLRRDHRAIDPVAKSFLLSVGRRKFLMPLYQAMIDAGRKEEARAIYKEARPGYHAIAQLSLDKLLLDKS